MNQNLQKDMIIKTIPKANWRKFTSIWIKVLVLMLCHSISNVLYYCCIVICLLYVNLLLSYTQVYCHYYWILSSICNCLCYYTCSCCLNFYLCGCSSSLLSLLWWSFFCSLPKISDGHWICRMRNWLGLILLGCMSMSYFWWCWWSWSCNSHTHILLSCLGLLRNLLCYANAHS